MAIQPAAIGIILDEHKLRVLLIKRRDVPVWVLPGGGIESGESAEAALLREIFEETGLVVAIDRQCAAYNPINRLAAQTFVFICHVLEGKLRLSNESSDACFFPLNALPPSLFFLHQQWMEEGLSSNHLIERPLFEVSYYQLFKYFLTHPLWVLRFAWTRLAR
jgi:ADP-ribose pyrophosphatase YjhB (NUDIX family)